MPAERLLPSTEAEEIVASRASLAQAELAPQAAAAEAEHRSRETSSAPLGELGLLACPA